MPNINVNNIGVVRNALEDFLKIEYTDGLINEFSTMEALINKLSSEQLTGKYKTKAFALGITDNIRALGKSNDSYELGLSDFTGAVDTVEAQFDTTKLMGVFSITDETLVKGTTDGSIFDVMQDSLQRMNMNIKHTLQRYTYGSANGLIGNLAANDATDTADFAGSGKTALEFSFANSYSVLPGMGLRIQKDANNFVYGKVFQKSNRTIGEDLVTFIILGTVGTVNWATDATTIYASQLNNAAGSNIAAEYHGLEDIVISQTGTLFGIDRDVYKSLTSTKQDLGDNLLTEDKLRDMSDHIQLTSPDGAAVNLVVSNHKIVSSLEKQLLSLKQVDFDNNGADITLGRGKIRFDQWEFMKDKYSRDKNVYLLDTGKIGELMRKDFGWITSGDHGVLSRRDGTEIYEGIMTKYSDMYIDTFKAHAVFTNVKETV